MKHTFSKPRLKSSNLTGFLTLVAVCGSNLISKSKKPGPPDASDAIEQSRANRDGHSPPPIRHLVQVISDEFETFQNHQIVGIWMQFFGNIWFIPRILYITSYHQFVVCLLGPPIVLHQIVGKKSENPFVELFLPEKSATPRRRISPPSEAFLGWSFFAHDGGHQEDTKELLIPALRRTGRGINGFQDSTPRWFQNCQTASFMIG